MKILVIRFSSIGDVVLTTPVIRCLKLQTKAEVHVVTKAAFQSVYEHNPYVDKCVLIEKSIREVVAELKQARYDYVIDLHHNIRTLKLKRALGVPSYSFPKKNIAKFLLTAFKINRLPKIHVVDRYFEAVKKLGVKNDGKPADFFLNEDDTVDLVAYNLSSKNYLAVAMGAQYATKQIPLEKLVDILQQQALPIVLLGGKMDEERSALVKSKLFEKKIVDFCGKIPLRSSAYLTKHASVILTGDTGLMHIASCFETPVVSVWGNTVPDFGMYAYFPEKPEKNVIHEVSNLTCRPCSKIGYQKCPKKHFHCMTQQDASKISASITAMKSH